MEPSTAVVSPMCVTTAQQAADAVFEAWDTVTGGLTLTWE
jgi:hypothetical protein